MTLVFRRTLLVVVSSLKRSKSSKARPEPKMQVFTQKRNPLTGSTEWDVQREDYDYHQEIARSAFADMLHDTERNKKYQRALQMAIERMHHAGKKANVLDIGTGTGLLSIMAARLGADSIVACEAFQPMADCCAKILARNGVADKITLIPKRSTELTVGDEGDMKQKANILVTEVFDTELIGEGALSTFSHAHKYLLEEDCIVVPESAVIYAQVVECPTLQKWNKLNDWVHDDLQKILKTPKNILECPGSAAVHDLQLSQLPRSAFRELSAAIPVFYYDWSGRSAVDMRRTVKQQFAPTNSGHAHMVFMWWELNMDVEGKIVISCAPWWCHPDADTSAERPQDTIPWRDHWMQAVYYLPQVLTVTKDQEVTLISCQDEYSLWFYLEDHSTKPLHYQRPVCECGVHMALSRTHISYLNDGKRSKKFMKAIVEHLGKFSSFLDLNGSSLVGVAAGMLNAKKVYLLENTNLHRKMLEDYIGENGLTNVKFVSKAEDTKLKKITNIICDPNFTTAILPWENLKMAYMIYQMKDKLRRNVTIIPESCTFYAMPVEFQDLHKIRVPLNKCEGIDMSIFDELVENSRVISDAEIEAQPLWEYPCKCRGPPRRLLELEMNRLQPKYACDAAFSVVDNASDAGSSLNGFALWMTWKVGGAKVCSGPVETPVVGQRVAWDPHTRQAVQILKTAHRVNEDDEWSYQIAADLERGQFNISLRLVPAE